MFIGHKFIQKDSVLVLYLEPQLTEFALDFFKRGKSEKKEERISLENGIYEYISKNLPNLKVGTVKVVIGSIIVASFSLGRIMPSYTQPAINQHQMNTMYSVKSGDTLYTISQRFDTTVSHLKKLNHLYSDTIYIGQQLKVISDQLYNIKYGDTLYTISQKFGTTISHLKQLNNLTDNVIYEGQQLKVIDPHQKIYTVKYGDTLSKIASMYDTQILPLKAINFLVEDIIYSDQTLYIPDHYTVTNSNSIMVLVNKKYSLPSDYIPSDLIVPNIPFTFTEYQPKKLLRQEAASALELLFNKAAKEGIQLFGLSGYRSYERQDAIFTSNVQRRGLKAANQFSAKPGESEHQTGLAIDVTSPSVNYGLSQAFGDTKEGKWLQENAPSFGFIIRYQKGKESITGYQYEPWHIRYVGIEAAQEITRRNITLEEYISNFFSVPAP